MKRHNPKKTPAADLGFHFTPLDYAFIHLAGRRAAQYMRTYGQGYYPPMIDLSHYIHNTKPDD